MALDIHPTQLKFFRELRETSPTLYRLCLLSIGVAAALAIFKVVIQRATPYEIVILLGLGVLLYCIEALVEFFDKYPRVRLCFAATVVVGVFGYYATANLKSTVTNDAGPSAPTQPTWCGLFSIACETGTDYAAPVIPVAMPMPVVLPSLTNPFEPEPIVLPQLDPFPAGPTISNPFPFDPTRPQANPTDRITPDIFTFDRRTPDGDILNWNSVDPSLPNWQIPDTVAPDSPLEEPQAEPIEIMPNGDNTVYFQFAGDLNRENDIKPLLQRLLALDWNGQGFERGGERTPAAYDTNFVRYFHPEDAGNARRLANAILASGPPRGSGQNLGIQQLDADDFNPAPARGIFEIWLSN